MVIYQNSGLFSWCSLVVLRGIAAGCVGYLGKRLACVNLHKAISFNAGPWWKKDASTWRLLYLKHWPFKIHHTIKIWSFPNIPESIHPDPKSPNQPSLQPRGAPHVSRARRVRRRISKSRSRPAMFLDAMGSEDFAFFDTTLDDMLQTPF